jgi:hypothetical protein
MKVMEVLGLTGIFVVLAGASALGALGEPLAAEPLAARAELAQEAVARLLRDAGTAGVDEEVLRAALERLPAEQFEMLTRSGEDLLAGGMTMGEAIAQLVLFAALAGLLILLLIILGVVALFVGGTAAASSSSGSAPMGKAQYDSQRQKAQEAKELSTVPEGQK